MKLSDVIVLIEDTIERKRQYLKDQEACKNIASFAEEAFISANIDFVTINIQELNRIVSDLKQVTEL